MHWASLGFVTSSPFTGVPPSHVGHVQIRPYAGMKGSREGNEMKEQGNLPTYHLHSDKMENRNLLVPQLSHSCASQREPLLAVSIILEFTPVFPVKCLGWHRKLLG